MVCRSRASPCGLQPHAQRPPSGRDRDSCAKISLASVPRGSRWIVPANLGRRLDMKTYVATPATREREWLVVDAADKTLGRLATQIADTLRGKRKPEYTPHCDVGDFVVVVNAEKVAVTGNKREA